MTSNYRLNSQTPGSNFATDLISREKLELDIQLCIAVFVVYLYSIEGSMNSICTASTCSVIGFEKNVQIQNKHA